MPSKLASADIKTRAMLEAVWDFEIHTVQSEPESILLEGKLIKEYRPRYNISFRDDKRFLVVKVDQTEEWPRFRLARFKKDDGARYFGPTRTPARCGKLSISCAKNSAFSPLVAARRRERELKSATYQVPTRLSEITAEQYRERVAQACDFLEGHSREMIAAARRQKCASQPENSISRRRPSCATCSMTFAEPQNRCGDSLATVCRARSIRTSDRPQRWPTRCNSPDLPRSWNVSTSPTSPPRTWWLRWSVFATAFQTRIIIVVTESGPSKARMISPAWRRWSGDDTPACYSAIADERMRIAERDDRSSTLAQPNSHRKARSKSQSA